MRNASRPNTSPEALGALPVDKSEGRSAASQVASLRADGSPAPRSVRLGAADLRRSTARCFQHGCIRRKHHNHRFFGPALPRQPVDATDDVHVRRRVINLLDRQKTCSDPRRCSASPACSHGARSRYRKKTPSTLMHPWLYPLVESWRKSRIDDGRTAHARQHRWDAAARTCAPIAPRTARTRPRQDLAGCIASQRRA